MPKNNDLPKSVTYSQQFYAKAAGMDVDLPEAITPEQKYLEAIAKKGESIGNIGDVEIDNPENGEVMKYDAEQGKWINGTASGGGGGGTSDYTDLTNKPKINGVTLAGNKSLSDIGAADASETYTETEVDALLAGKVDKVDGKGLSTEDFTASEKSKLSGIESGAEANVQADWEQSDDTAEDYIKNKPTIPAAQVNADWDAASGVAQILNKPTLGAAAAKGVDSSPTTSSANLVESGGVATALAGKQDTLTSAQQAAVDSGITSAKVAAYDKDAAVLPEIVNGGAKNLSPVASGTNESGTRYAEIAIALPAGTYVVYFGNLTSDDTDASTCGIGFFANGTRVSTPSTSTIARGNGVYITLTVSSTADTLRIYASDTSAHAANDTVSFTGLMICTKAAWDVSQAYVPYCPSMAEMYEETCEEETVTLTNTLSTSICDVQNSSLVVYRKGKMCIARLSAKIDGTLTGNDEINTTAMPTAIRPKFDGYFAFVSRDAGGWASANMASVVCTFGSNGKITIRSGTNAASAACIVGTATWFIS